MLRTDIAAEMRSARAAFGEAERAPLLDLPPASLDSGLIGFDRIALDGSLYTPDSYGAPAYITPVVLMYGDLVRQEAPSDRGATVDLVAWHPATPGRWALRLGIGKVLGVVLWWQEGPIRINRTPLSWFRGEGRGLCFLDPDPAVVRDTLRDLADLGVRAEDHAHAEALRRACEHPYSAPRILAA